MRAVKVIPSITIAVLTGPVNVAPIPEAPLLYVHALVFPDVVVAADTDTAGFCPAIAFATAVVTKAVVAALVVLSPAD